MNDVFFGAGDWLSLEWFSFKNILTFTWANGFVLSLLPLIPIIFLLRWLFHFNFRQKIDIALPADDLKKWSIEGLLRFIPNVFFSLFVVAVIVALARPQKSSQKIESHRMGIDIVLVLDISESMMLEDLKPNRLEAAKRILRDFIEKRGNDRIGVVVFSGSAYTLVPLTTDHHLLKQSVEEINTYSIDTGSTAIGNAIAVAINRFQESFSKSKIIILITDGENTEGNIGPETAAQLAYAKNIRIYSIGVGKNGITPFGKDNTGKTLYVQSALNEKALTRIGALSNGKFMKASDGKMLEDIFQNIDELEKGEIKEIRFNDNKDYYQVYLVWGIIFFIFWMLTKSTFLTNAMED